MKTLREKEVKITLSEHQSVNPLKRHHLVLDLVIILYTELWLSAHIFLLDGLFMKVIIETN